MCYKLIQLRKNHRDSKVNICMVEVANVVELHFDLLENFIYYFNCIIGCSGQKWEVTGQSGYNFFFCLFGDLKGE